MTIQRKRLAAFLSAALLILLAASPVSAGELSETTKLIKQWAEKTIKDAEFVEDCLGFSETPELCDAADDAGTGLVCPGPPEPTENSHSCALASASSLDTFLGAKGVQVAEFSAEYSVQFVMIGEEKSIPPHMHKPDCSGNECAEKYVKRQEKVSVYFAAAQKGKISTDPIDSFAELEQFKAGIEGKKAESFQVTNHHYCVWQDHGDPRSCGGGGPITPGEDPPTCRCPAEDPACTGVCDPADPDCPCEPGDPTCEPQPCDPDDPDCQTCEPGDPTCEPPCHPDDPACQSCPPGDPMCEPPCEPGDPACSDP